jgi:Ca-activated chloride channel homolog
MSTVHIEQLRDEQVTRSGRGERDREAGLGALRTERGNLPLHRLDVHAAITGLVARIQLTQGFRNPYDIPLEATYVFPLPDRAAVTRMVLTAEDRTVEGVLRERATAREEYDKAIAAGQRAGIAEEDRPDVFTMRVGNILPGEQVSVLLELAGPLSLVDGQAEFRFPLVVAPRYIPGAPLPGEPVGDGYAPDTDAVPDASRITPPVLLPGFPNPVALSIEATVDPAGLELRGIASSLHAVDQADGVIAIRPGQRVDRDFILRLSYLDGGSSLALVPDADGDEGTYQLTVLPPAPAGATRPRDVVLVLDRSGSMGGWKMVAARRAAARIVDTLTDADRFAVLTFDTVVERPDGLPADLVPGNDRNRFRAVEHLSATDARGGTEMLAPLREALRMLGDGAGERGGDEAGGRDRVLVLVTDGQVGNEDQILRKLDAKLSGVRVHTVGIDRAVNAAFLRRLATAGRGQCELVESEDRLDEAMEAIHRRIGAPLVTGLSVHTGLNLVPGSQAPARMPDLFPGVPLVLAGRYTGATAGEMTLAGRGADGERWQSTVPATVSENRALTAIWARGHLRDLEDHYAVAGGDPLEQQIVATSLRFGVLCRFTAYLAVDSRVVTDGDGPHRVIQPVELPAGWQPMPSPATFVAAAMPAPAPMSLMTPKLSEAPARRLTRAAPDAAPAGAAEVARQVGPAPSSTVPSRPPAPGPAYTVDPLAAHVAVAAQRLAAEQAAAPERREVLLGKLVGDLERLLKTVTAAHVAGRLRDLLAVLRDRGRPLDERWAEALKVLRELGPRTSDGPSRRAFWKRW